MPKTLVIEVVGEGRLDIGQIADPHAEPSAEIPHVGVVPIFVYKLCGGPASMLVKRRQIAFLQKGGLARKILFGKQRAFYSGSHGLVVVHDTEGRHAEVMKGLVEGRDAKYLELPTAIGAAHPCIEAWLLCDAAAIAEAMTLSHRPEIPIDPESLPAPQDERSRRIGEARNPKALLGHHAGQTRSLSAKEATRIATAIRDLGLLRERCPLGFAPFADEVERNIMPLFVDELPNQPT